MSKIIEKRLFNVMNDITSKYASKVDTRIYRILSGEFKLRKDGELDMRFKENKNVKDN